MILGCVDIDSTHPNEFLKKTIGNTAQRLCRRCAVDFFVRVHKGAAGILTYPEGIGCTFRSSIACGSDSRCTAGIFQGFFVYYDGKRSSRFGARCQQHTKKSSRKAQTDWIVLQMPLGCRQAVFVRCCLYAVQFFTFCR